MNNTEKLIASNILVKQAFLQAAKNLGKGAIQGAGTGMSDILKFLTRGKVQPKGLRSLTSSAGLEGNNMLNFNRGKMLGDSAVKGVATGLPAGLAVGAVGNKIQQGKSRDAALQAFIQQQQQQKDQGYFGRLLDAITNKGY